MSAISIKNLTKTYKNGVEALKGIDLVIEPGSFSALLGANGAGKTTVIGILTGLVNKTSGEVSVFGYDLDREPEMVRQQIGVVPQEFNFNMFENVQDIVVNQAGYFGIERTAALEYSEYLLKRLDLWEKKNQPSRGLSGGMKRRLMIARALVNKPKLLILDEPTAGVDVELRYSMWEFLKELNAQGTTILLTTHYLEEVEQLCQDAAMIKGGKIIANDKVSNLLRTIDQETFVVTVTDRGQSPLGAVPALLSRFQPKVIDEHAFEVVLSKKDHLNDLVGDLTKAGIELHDIRPKGNRMERLFLNILKQ